MAETTDFMARVRVVGMSKPDAEALEALLRGVLAKIPGDTRPTLETAFAKSGPVDLLAPDKPE